MKYIVLFLLGSMYTCALSAQGIDFKAHTWEEAQRLAEAEGKIIFVDCYTTWCGPCKRLAKNVFPLESVGDYFNTHFVSFKLNMETPEGSSFRKKYGVSSYPTLYFIAPNGDVVQKTSGAPRDAKSMIAVAATAMDKYDPGAAYTKLYDEGDHSAKTTLGLIQSLNRRGKPSLKYTNTYLREAKDLGADSSLQIIFHGLTQLDSRVFDHFIEHKDAIITLHGADAVQAKMRTAGMETAKMAAIFESEEVLQEGITKYESVFPADAKAFKARANMAYALEAGDASRYADALGDVDKNDEEYANLLLKGIRTFHEDEAAMSSFKKKCKSLMKSHPSADQAMMMGELLIYEGDLSGAKKVLEGVETEELPKLAQVRWHKLLEKTKG